MNLRKNTSLLLTAATLLTGGAAHRPAVAHAADAPTAGQFAKGCRPSRTTALSPNQLSDATAGKPMDGICFVAGACTTIWPIGTLICGPTALGCAIYYWQQ
jgi:hypothetical protein